MSTVEQFDDELISSHPQTPLLLITLLSIEEQVNTLKPHPPKLPLKDVKVLSSIIDGRTVYILHEVTKAMRQANISSDVISMYERDATSRDISHLIATTRKWVVLV